MGASWKGDNRPELRDGLVEREHAGTFRPCPTHPIEPLAGPWAVFVAAVACGAVRYELQTTPICVQACTAGSCQRLTGSAFSINALIETDRIRGLGATVPEPIETWTTYRTRRP